MSFSMPLFRSSSRCIFKYGISTSQTPLSPVHPLAFLAPARFKSGLTVPAAKPPRPISDLGQSTFQREAKSKSKSARRASLSPDSFNKSAKPSTAAFVKKSAVDATKSPRSSGSISHRGPVKSANQHQTQGQNRERPLTGSAAAGQETGYTIKFTWPSLWTVLAVAGTYYTFAYLDVKAGVPSSDGSQLPDRAQLPQDWLLTPTVISEGVKAAWDELDKYTMGIIVAAFAIHLIPVTRNYDKSPVKYSRNYSLVRAAFKAGVLAWFLPSVVRYFDGDLFHTMAFLISLPLITSYFTHSAARIDLLNGGVRQFQRRTPLEFAINCYGGVVSQMGGSSVIAATFGVYTVVYANEKLWTPQTLVGRLDPLLHALLFVASQALGMAMGPLNFRYAHMTNLLSFLLGRTYAAYNLKHHVWIPLVSEISSTQD